MWPISLAGQTLTWGVWSARLVAHGNFLPRTMDLHIYLIKDQTLDPFYKINGLKMFIVQIWVTWAYNFQLCSIKIN